MKKTFFTCAVVAVSLFALAAGKAADDPVLMKINGKDVKKSEFEYLYLKNNSQQVEPQTIDQYVDLFINYKLKVADAEAAGLDKSESFLKEYASFRNELAAPYMVDNSVLDSLVADVYKHYLDEVFVSHIMLPYTGQQEVDEQNYIMLDSLRQEIISGKSSFADVAMKYSVDRGSKARGGKMSWVTPGRFPWAFEKASYDTPLGQISEIVKTEAYGRPIGFHLIRVDERRPARGEVKVQHILKLTRGVSDSLKVVALNQIDSIYNVVTAPGVDFAEVAKVESQDPGSARNGGLIDWFTSGMMVQEFDSVAFALADGEISKPFESPFGYHIIKKLEHRGVKSLDEMRETIKTSLGNDDRADLPAKARLNQLKAEHNAKIIPGSMDKVLALIRSVGQYDSIAVEKLSASNIPVVEIDGKKHPVSEAMPYAAKSAAVSAEAGMTTVNSAADMLLTELTRQAASDDLFKTNPDYRNLLNEYRDGILLFDISNTKVWDRAATDSIGLRKFFDANRDRYKWDGPRFKSYIIFVANDSIAQLARAYTDTLTEPVNHDEFVKEMRNRFGKSNVKIERVIAPKGKNVITDYLAFGGEKPAAEASRWPVYYAFQGRIIDSPEEPLDVKGAVTTDYQAYLEEQWVKELRSKAKIKIDRKVLETIK